MKTTLGLAIMDKSQTVGRIFVAVSLVVFGVQHFLYGGFVAGLVPAFMPGRLFWAYFVGVAFFAAAAGILRRNGTAGGDHAGSDVFSFLGAPAHSEDRHEFARWE